MDNKEIEQQLKKLQDQINESQAQHPKDQMSMIIFSGDMDKILGAFIVAIGAAAMDMEVKMFFSFWALSALRDINKKVSGKNFISKMFGFMLPKGMSKLKLSRMNMGGMGTSMIKSIMKKHKVASLEEMLATAAELEIEIDICEMSMDLMGFKKEEMIDYPNLIYCGVGTFVADASESRVHLFI